MSNYQKFSLQTIREKLKSGDYASSVGANRAIGKTQELSEEDKVKAKAMVAKHFGVDLQAPKATKKTAKRAKKAEKKVSAKKVAKAAGAKKTGKRAKKTAKKAAKKAAKASAKAGAAAPAQAKTPKARVGDAVVARVPTELATKEPVKREAAASMSTMNTMGTVISTLSQALQSMETAKRLFPKADLEAGVAAAAGSMTRAVRVLDREVLGPLLPDDTKAAAGKTKGKKGKRPKAAATAPVEPAEEPADSGDEEEGNTDAEPDELSPEERAQVEAARELQPDAAKKYSTKNGPAATGV